MLDIGFSELLVIGLVALIVIGPKDLPGMFQTLGRFTARARQMAREFQRAMEDAADESGMKDAAKTVKGMTNPKKMGLDALNDAADKFDKWEPGKSRTTKSASEKTASSASGDAAGAKLQESGAGDAKALDADDEMVEEAPKPKTPAQEAKERGA